MRLVCLVLSPDALTSDWVKQETDQAMTGPRFRGMVLPVLAEPCEWKTLHEHLGRYKILDYVNRPKEAEAKLLEMLGAPQIVEPLWVGDVKMPVYVFVGATARRDFAQATSPVTGLACRVTNPECSRRRWRSRSMAPLPAEAGN